MNVLDLFSGIGGFSLGLERAGMKTIAFCEKDKFCQKVLRKHWPNVPVFDDITKLSGLVLDNNDGICYNKLCEVNDNDKQAFKILDKQNKLKKINELIVSAKVVGKGCPCLQAWLLEVGNFVPQNVDMATCGESLHQTQMVEFGCVGQEIQTGKVVVETKGDKDIERLKLQNGEEGYSQEIYTHVKNVKSNQKKIINYEHTISNSGVNTQKVDLNCLMEKLYAKSATISCTKKRGKIDIISAGVPCQPASVAGKRKGTKDDRWLWGETYRIIREAKPQWVLLENVKGILSLEQGVVFENLLLELESYGYETETFIIPACAINAPHRRDRVWIIAYSEGIGRKRWSNIKEKTSGKDGEGIAIDELERSSETCNSLSDTASKRCDNRTDNRCERHILRNENRNASEGKPERERWKCGIRKADSDASDSRCFRQEKSEIKTMGSEQLCGNDTDSTNERLQRGIKTNGEQGKESNDEQSYGLYREWDENWIEVATRLCRMDVRVPSRVDRLKCLGNSVVPQIVEIIGHYIMEIERTSKIQKQMFV